MVDHIAGACGHDQCQSLDDEREQQAQTDGGHVPAEEPGQDGDGSAARPYGNGCAAVVCRLRNQHRARTVGREFAGRIGMAPVRRVSDAESAVCVMVEHDEMVVVPMQDAWRHDGFQRFGAGGRDRAYADAGVGQHRYDVREAQSAAWSAVPAAQLVHGHGMPECGEDHRCGGQPAFAVLALFDKRDTVATP